MKSDDTRVEPAATVSPSPPPEAFPRPFGNYLLLRELGRGAQGVVFLAEDTHLGRKVALKMLTGAGAMSQLTRDRFRREGQLTSKLEHPGICGVHDVGEVDGMPYIAMQYVRGTTLAQLILDVRAKSGDAKSGDSGASARSPSSTTISIAGRESKGGLEDVLHLVERAARALHVAHGLGLIHRDIKPANIMVTPEGNPVLLDFGLARDVEAEGQTLTQSGQILGTPAYLAPEQIVASRGVVDQRTDVYALGVTLFEALTLRRPFEQQTWDQLFHEILNGAPPNPRKLNPRIPRDLGVIIDVALDRDPSRRYATAEEFAEDLRRVRSFEPIQAQAAGPVSRLQKWTRRSPGRAVAVGAVVLFAFVGAITFVVRTFQERSALRANIAAASSALANSDFDGALLAAAQARQIDPDSAQAIALQARIESARDAAVVEQNRRKDLAAAAAARDEAVHLRASYDDARHKIEVLAGELARDQPAVLARYAVDESRGQFARRQSELAALEVEAERLLLAHEETLQRAARFEAPWGGASEATEGALAQFYLGRWREALAANDQARVEVMRSAVEAHDPKHALEAELLGRGSLVLAVVPADAELFLFRWESYETVRAGDVIPRLVPVPTAGVGRVRPGEWSAGFFPGDECFVVRSVERDSPAARANLRAGDLVLRVGGMACRSALFLREAPADSAVAKAGVPVLAHVVALDDTPVEGMFDWRRRVLGDKEALHRVEFSAPAKAVSCDPREIRLASALELVHAGAPAAIRLECLRAGEIVTVDVPAGARSGLACELTAYPLILAAQNRLAPGSSVTADPGSYLLLARADGREDLRTNLVVGRRARVETRIELLPAGTTPPGFVWIPPGPFVEGGDPQAFNPRARSTTDVPGFALARKELENREWYEFLNDPVTLAKIAAADAGTHLYVPQDDRVLARKASDGLQFEWDVYYATTADSPVLGISWNDAQDYLEWRNRKAAANGEAWRYDLPGESEWEKAARGVDGRAFPWGDRFDPSLTTCRARKDGFLLDAPGGFEPRDESPFGVLDMAGSREEWLRDAVEGSEGRTRRKRGGYWGTIAEIAMRCASRPEVGRERFASSQGLRLVLRRP